MCAVPMNAGSGKRRRIGADTVCFGCSVIAIEQPAYQWFSTVATWLIEGGSPNELIRLGVTKNTLEIGTALTVEGYHAKDGTDKAVGRNFLLADGQRLFLGGSANRIGDAR